jgi:hypothetical protein
MCVAGLLSSSAPLPLRYLVNRIHHLRLPHFSLSSFTSEMASHQSVSVADLKDIQAGPLYVLHFVFSFTILTTCLSLSCRVSAPTRAVTFIFFSINDPIQFRHLLKVLLPFVTTSDEVRKRWNEVYQAKAADRLATLASINVSFSYRGLAKLSVDSDIKDDAFKEGQLKRAPSLGDNTEKWLPAFKDNPIDGLFKVTGHPVEHVLDIVRDKIKIPFISSAITIIFEHHGHVRPGQEKGHEHCESTPYSPHLPSRSDHDSRLQRWHISTLCQIRG